MGLKRWLSEGEHWLLLQRMLVLFPGSQPSVIPVDRDLTPSFWPLEAAGMQTVPSHTYRQNTCTHKLKINKSLKCIYRFLTLIYFQGGLPAEHTCRSQGQLPESDSLPSTMCVMGIKLGLSGGWTASLHTEPSRPPLK